MQVAKAEKLKPLELALRKMEDMSEAIVNDFARMKAREQEHRDTNGLFGLPINTAVIMQSDTLLTTLAESTNERLLMFSLISMGALLALAVWQVLYLKRYFRQKKLI
jgi:hypothetical protein